MHIVNCSPPQTAVPTAKAALLHTNPATIQATKPRCGRPGSRATHPSIATSVPTVQATDSHGATVPYGTVGSSTHRKLG